MEVDWGENESSSFYPITHLPVDLGSFPGFAVIQYYEIGQIYTEFPICEDTEGELSGEKLLI